MEDNLSAVRNFSRPGGVIDSLPIEAAKSISGKEEVREAAWKQRVGGWILSVILRIEDGLAESRRFVRDWMCEPTHCEHEQKVSIIEDYPNIIVQSPSASPTTNLQGYGLSRSNFVPPYNWEDESIFPVDPPPTAA